MSNPREGFVFHAESCSRNCSNGKQCSHCALKTNVGNKVRESVQDIVEGAGKQGKQAMITNILSNPVFVAMEICMAREEIRRLRCELARVVLFDAMEKDGAIFSGRHRGQPDKEGSQDHGRPHQQGIAVGCGNSRAGALVGAC